MANALVPQYIYYGEDAVKHIFWEQGKTSSQFLISALLKTLITVCEIPIIPSHCL